MIFTIGCAIVGVLAALMVTSPARKKQIDKATKKSPKKKGSRLNPTIRGRPEQQA